MPGFGTAGGLISSATILAENSSARLPNAAAIRFKRDAGRGCQCLPRMQDNGSIVSATVAQERDQIAQQILGRFFRNEMAAHQRVPAHIVSFFTPCLEHIE